MKKRGQDDPEISCTLNTAVPQPIDTAHPNTCVRDCVYYSSRVYVVTLRVSQMVLRVR